MKNKNIKKILFVIPSYSDVVYEKYMKQRTIPYGVLSLIAYIEYYFSEMKFEILDMNTIPKTDQHEKVLVNLLEKFKPDLVAFYITFNYSIQFIEVFSKLVKISNPEILLLVGGIVATNLPDTVFRESNLIDALCYAEGEEPLKDLLMSCDIEKTLKTHKSWITKEDFLKGKKGQATFVENLDDIPTINYSYVNFDNYGERNISFDGNPKRTVPVHTTRGCPYNCIFCCASANHGKAIRYMSPKRFLLDIKIFIEKYKIEKITIDDDQFLFDKKRAKKILIGLGKLNIEIEMQSGLSVKFIDDEIAMLLKKAGLKTAVLAIESGSPSVLKNIIEKPLKIEQIEPAVKALRKQNLLVHAFFILGLPGEQDADRKMTRDLIIDIGFDWCNIFIATPFKGSRLYDLCIEKKYFANNDSSNIDFYCGSISAPGIDPKKIAREVYLLNLDVNFVNNYNYKNNFYEKAALYFKKISDLYPEQAFAHFFYAKSLEKINSTDKKIIQSHYDDFQKIIDKSAEWQSYYNYFKESLGKFVSKEESGLND